MKKKLFLFLLLASVMVLSSCDSGEDHYLENLQQDDSNTSDTSNTQKKNPVTIEVTCGGRLDVDTLLSCFYDETEDAKTKAEWIYNQKENSFTFCDWQILEECGYGELFPQELVYQEVANLLMEFPAEDEWENYSSEQAIEACKSFAKICGYEDAEITSYAVTLSDLWRSAWIVTPYETLREDANYDKRFVQGREIQDAQKRESIELGSQLSEQQRFINDYVLRHTDNLEAYLLVYRTCVNGLLVDADAHQMWCIYVPEHKKVIAMAAGCPLVATSMETGTNTMSVYKAIDTAELILGDESSQDILFTDIEMVYTTKEELGKYFTESETLNPCWKISYFINTSAGDTSVLEGKHEGENVIFVDAVTGIKIK